MKTKNLFTSILLILSITLSTYAIKPIKNLLKETKVVYVFDNKTKKLTGIILFEAVNNKKGKAILKKYDNCSFFIGYLNGEFKEKNSEVLPVKGTLVIIYRDKKFLPGDQFLPGNQFLPGDQFIVFYEGWLIKWKGEIPQAGV